MAQRTTATGVNLTPINIKGKDYVTVSQRIAEVNASGMVPRFQILSTEFKEFGGVNICQITIEIEGRKFIGTSSVNIGGRGVDATNPIENAETSALGRALGLAGFGSLESVASAEEVITAVSRQDSKSQNKPAAPAHKPAGNRPLSVVQDVPAVAPSPDSPLTKENREKLTQVCKDTGWVGADFKELLDSLELSWKGLSNGDADALINYMLKDPKLPPI